MAFQLEIITLIGLLSLKRTDKAAFTRARTHTHTHTYTHTHVTNGKESERKGEDECGKGRDVFIPHLLDGRVPTGSRDVEKICLWSAVGLTALTTPCRGPLPDTRVTYNQSNGPST
jgi:hypothetical protein